MFANEAQMLVQIDQVVFGNSHSVRERSMGKITGSPPAAIAGSVDRAPAQTQQWLGDGMLPKGSTSKDNIGVFRDTLGAICWQIYQKVRQGTDAQIIGREKETDPFKLSHSNLASYFKVRFGISEVQYVAAAARPGSSKGPAAAHGASEVELVKMYNLSGDNIQANVLKMERWHPAMNDAWILGGLHRDRPAEYKLVSKIGIENIWNDEAGYLIVTAREILGLLRFGYQIVPPDPASNVKELARFVIKDPAKARNADFLQYDQLVSSIPSKTEALIRLKVIGVNGAGVWTPAWKTSGLAAA